MTETEEKIQILNNIKNELRKEYEQNVSKVNDLLIKLLPLCEHSEIIKKESYIEGSYFDKEEYITNYYCAICHKHIKEEKKYGRFG